MAAAAGAFAVYMPSSRLLWRKFPHHKTNPRSSSILVGPDLSHSAPAADAGAERANATRVKPSQPAGSLGPRKVTAVLIWFWPLPPVGVRTAGAGGNGGVELRLHIGV